MSVTVNAGYNGGLAGEILVEAFKKSDTIAKNAITVLPNNIGKGYLPTLTYDADLQEYACGFDPEGDVVYKDVTVTMYKYKIDDEFCKDEFHQTFQAQKLGLFSAANDIPADIQTAILGAIVYNVGAKVEKAIWRGDGILNNFEGLLDKMESDTTAIVAASNKIDAAAVTSSNVMTEIAKVYDAILDEILESKDLVISVSPNVARAYKQAQINMGLNTSVGDKELDYLGVRMESLAGLPANTMVAYRVKNLGFLTGLESDFNQVRVKDMDEQDLSGNLRTKVVFEMGAGYSFGEEIVFYRTAP